MELELELIGRGTFRAWHIRREGATHPSSLAKMDPPNPDFHNAVFFLTRSNRFGTLIGQ